MKAYAAWFFMSIGLLASPGVSAQLANPGTASAPVLVATGSCQPACGANQICASTGQCMQLVRLAAESPEPPEPPAPEKTLRSKPLMVTGIVMTSAGVVTVAVGLVELVLAGFGCYVIYNPSEGERCGSVAPLAKKGGLTMLAGAGVIMVGVPILVYGAHPVEKRPHALRAGPSVELVAGPASLALRGTF
jgi:hypothetical protein